MPIDLTGKTALELAQMLDHLAQNPNAELSKAIGDELARQAQAEQRAAEQRAARDATIELADALSHTAHSGLGSRLYPDYPEVFRVDGDHAGAARIAKALDSGRSARDIVENGPLAPGETRTTGDSGKTGR